MLPSSFPERRGERLDVPLVCLFRATVGKRNRNDLRDQRGATPNMCGCAPAALP
jgi:hypothetical protein